MSVHPKVIYRFNTVPIIFLLIFFFFFYKVTLKEKWKDKGPRISRAFLQKENKTGGLILLNFKRDYKTVVTETRVVA